MGRETTPEWLHLSEGEEVVWESRPHPVEMGRRLPLGLFVVFVGIVLVAWGTNDGGVSLVNAVGLVIAAAGAVVLLVQYVYWTNTRYVITTSQLYEKRGVVSTDVTQCRLDRVQNTSLSQSVIGRVLGYGDLTVYTAGSGDPELTFERLPRPHEASTVLSEQLNGAEAHSRAP